jgi:hypothetical protein
MGRSHSFLVTGDAMPSWNVQDTSLTGSSGGCVHRQEGFGPHTQREYLHTKRLEVLGGQDWATKFHFDDERSAGDFDEWVTHLRYQLNNGQRTTELTDDYHELSSLVRDLPKLLPVQGGKHVLLGFSNNGNCLLYASEAAHYLATGRSLYGFIREATLVTVRASLKLADTARKEFNQGGTTLTRASQSCASITPEEAVWLWGKTRVKHPRWVVPAPGHDEHCPILRFHCKMSEEESSKWTTELHSFTAELHSSPVQLRTPAAAAMPRSKSSPLLAPSYIPFKDSWPPCEPVQGDTTESLYRLFVNMGTDMDASNGITTQASVNLSNDAWKIGTCKIMKTKARFLKWTDFKRTLPKKSDFFSPRHPKTKRRMASPSPQAPERVDESADADHNSHVHLKSTKKTQPSGFCQNNLCSETLLTLVLSQTSLSDAEKTTVHFAHARMNKFTCHHFACCVTSSSEIFMMIKIRAEARQRDRKSQLKTDVKEFPGELDSFFRQLNRSDHSNHQMADACSKFYNKVVKPTEAELKKRVEGIAKATMKNTKHSAEVTDTWLSPNAGKSWDEVTEKLMQMDETSEWIITRNLLYKAAEFIARVPHTTLAELDSIVVPNGMLLRAQQILFHEAIVTMFPVLFMSNQLHSKRNGIIVNMRFHDLETRQSLKERLASYFKEKAKKKQTPSDEEKRGRIPFHQKFPDLIKIITRIIDDEQPQAEYRRRVDVLRTGVSFATIRDRLAREIPELADIDVRTIARLMVAPNLGHLSEAQYKGLVNAKVQPSTNNRREFNEDGHFSAAGAKFIKEMSAFVGDECMEMSADEKANLIVGLSGVVSRYHRNRNITPLGVQIAKYDHDYLTTGYAIGMAGFLEVVHEDQHETYIDELGRLHVKGGTAGTCHLDLHALKYVKPDIQTHAAHLRRLLTEMKRTGRLRPVLVLTVDGGVDFVTDRLATVYLYGEIFRDFGFECLIMHRRSGGLSAWNDIERVWAKVSRKLANLIVPATLNDEPNAPIDQGLSKSQVVIKELQVFDNACELIKATLSPKGNPFTYNNHPVNIHTVRTRHDLVQRMSRDNSFKELVKINTLNVKTCPTKARIAADQKTFLKHLEFSKFRLVFTSCKDKACTFEACAAKHQPGYVDPAPRFHRVHKAFNNILPTGCPSLKPDLKKHFDCFLSMLHAAENGATFPPPDHHRPSAEMLAGVQFCTRQPPCSNYFRFLGVSQRLNHDKFIHTIERKRDINLPPMKGMYRVRCSECKENFPGEDSLKEHCDDSNNDCSFEDCSLYRYFGRNAGLALSEKKKKEMLQRAKNLKEVMH